MAEIAIPLALLGGMYIVSNTDKKSKQSKKEGFNNRELTKNAQRTIMSQPSNNVNYPSQSKTHNTYNQDEFHGNTTNAKYFKDNYSNDLIQQKYSQNKNELYTSLTGNVELTSQMTHNNQVPFFGSKVKQTNATTDSQMDYMTGAGSTFIHKKEQPPLFTPESNMAFAHGAPNNVAFMRDRIEGNVSSRRANDKPWEEIRVGPGLGKGAGTEGSGGFNSGLEARELWMAKTVDDLRVKTNPKLTYNGVILGPKAQNTERGDVGVIEKRRPDTFYENSPDRYFTTTGIEKAPTTRSQQVSSVMNEENRNTTSVPYYGNKGDTDGKGTYVPQNFREPHKQNIESTSKHTTGISQIGGVVSEGDYGIHGFKQSILPNNRSLDTKKSQEYGGVSTAVKAMFTPLLDMLRPSRKQNVVGNARPQGNVNGVFGNKTGYVLNPADRPKTTIKEMNVHHKDHHFVGNQSGDTTGYMTANPVVYGQQRDTTQYCDMGNVGGNASTTGQTMLYNSAYNANLIDKAPLSKGRAPMGGGPRVLNSNLHMTKYKDQKLVEQKQLNAPSIYNKLPPSRELMGSVDRRKEIGQNVHSQRMEQMDFTAFNNNPYTHSLTNAVAY